MSVNKAILLGHLGKDVELKYTSGATPKAVASFSMATSEEWTDKNGEKQEKTEWHNIEVWGKLAELCQQYLKKGSQCFVEGSIKTESFDGKDGNKKYFTKVNARTVQFLTAKDSSTMSDRNQGVPF